MKNSFTVKKYNNLSDPLVKDLRILYSMLTLPPLITFWVGEEQPVMTTIGHIET